MIETDIELTHVIEYSTEIQDRVLDISNGFLSSPDAANIPLENFLRSSSNTEFETVIKTFDAASNTAFHVESVYPAGSPDPDAKKTIISWLTFGDDKGDLPAGRIEILESGGKRKMYAHKTNKLLISSDEDFLWDEGYVDTTVQVGPIPGPLPEWLHKAPRYNFRTDWR